MGRVFKFIILTASAFVVSACVVDPVPYDRPIPQSEQEISFVKTVLADAQTKSLKDGREYCGYIGVDADRAYIATPPKRGRKSSCRSGDVPAGFSEIASYHTHGIYSDGHDSELPSIEDIEADIFEGNDGYVSTPGGRVWFIDGFKMTAKVICDENCVRADDAYVANLDLPIGRTYTLDALEQLFEELE